MNQAILRSGFDRLNDLYIEDFISKSSSRERSDYSRSFSRVSPLGINMIRESDSGRSFNNYNTKKECRTDGPGLITMSISRGRALEEMAQKTDKYEPGIDENLRKVIEHLDEVQELHPIDPILNRIDFQRCDLKSDRQV